MPEVFIESAVEPERLIETPPWRMWAALAVIIVADVLDLLDSTITNLAAPSIVRDLGGGAGLIEWLGASYSLALGALLILGGRLGDRFGKRRTFLLGIAGFTVASIACGLAPSPGWLLAARVAQGASGAVMIPQGFGMISLIFPRELMGKVFSVFGPVMSISSIGGPIVAGFIIDANILGLGWRPIFLINVVLGSAAFVAALRWLPDDAGAPSDAVDGIGGALLGAAMFGLLYGLVDGAAHGWSMKAILFVVCGLVSFGAFCVRQATARAPLLPRTLLRNRGFTSGLVLGLAFFAAVNGVAYVLSLFIQGGLGRSPSAASLSLLPLTVGIVIASVATASLSEHGRNLIAVGLSVCVVGVLALVLLVSRAGAGVGVLPMSTAILVVGLGMGSCFGTIFDVALGDTDPREASSASGALSAIQQLAGGMGSALVTTVYFSLLGVHGPSRAMVTTLAIAGAALLSCCALVWLLPKKAAEGHGR